MTRPPSPKSKETLRRELLSRRKDAARQPQEPVGALWQRAQAIIPAEAVIAGYHPIGSEIDPGSILEGAARQGLPTALPTVSEGSEGLIFRAWQPGDALQQGPFKTKEPLADAGVVMPDIILVPLVGVDASGTRLGMGQGFYDRTLGFLRAKKNIKAVGLCYRVQVCDHIPREPHDQPLDAIITENAFAQFPLTKEDRQRLGLSG